MLIAIFIIITLGLLLFSLVAVSLSTIKKRDVTQEGYKVWMNQTKHGAIRIDHDRRMIVTPDLKLSFGQVNRVRIVENHEYTDVYLLYTDKSLRTDWIEFSIHKKSDPYQPNEAFIQELQWIARGAGGEATPVEKQLNEDTARLAWPLRKIAETLKTMTLEERQQLELELSHYQLRIFLKQEVTVYSEDEGVSSLMVREGFRFFSPECQTSFLFLHTFDAIYLAEVDDNGQTLLLYQEKSDHWYRDELWLSNLQSDIWFIARVLSESPSRKNTIST